MKSAPWGLFVALAACVLSPCYAQDCGALLVPDVSFTHLDVSTDLSYLSVVSSSTFEQHKKNAEGGMDIPIAKGLLRASASYEEFSEKRAQEYKKYNWEYSHRDLSTFYQSRLPEHLAKSFNECMNRLGFQGRITRADKEYIEVVVTWRPFPNGPTTVDFGDPFIRGGSLVGPLPARLSYSEERTLNFRRTAGEAFRFNANVGGTTASVFVPPYVRVVDTPSPPALPTPNRYYYVQSLVSGLFLDVFGGGTSVGTNVVQAPKNPSQVWKLIPAEKSGYFYLQSKINNLFLDVFAANKAIGGNVDVASKHPDQVWALIPAEEAGYYYVQSQISGLNLDVYAGSSAPGANVDQAARDPRQVWRFIQAE